MPDNPLTKLAQISFEFTTALEAAMRTTREMPTEQIAGMITHLAPIRAALGTAIETLMILKHNPTNNQQ